MKKKNTDIHSLGSLRPNQKTKQKQPDLIGSIVLQPQHVEQLAGALVISGRKKIRCKLAGWKNKKNGSEFLSVILSGPFYICETEVESEHKAPTLDSLFPDSEPEGE